MDKSNIIVIGASAGGVEALSILLGKIPAAPPAAIFIVQHLSPHGMNKLAEVLGRSTPVPVRNAEDGGNIEMGHVYLAPPDQHLLLRPGKMILRRGPHENRTRPAIDVLFRSAAIHYGARVIGVVLTGLLDDGTEGLIAIKSAGGISVVQDPKDAAWPSMPQQALMRDHVDHKLPLAEIPELLMQLALQDAKVTKSVTAATIAEDRIAGENGVPMVQTPGEPSPWSCPTCGGVLNRIEDRGSVRFRCQIGHAFTSVGLEVAQTDEIEHALAVAARTHRERMRLFNEMEVSAQGRNLSMAAARWKTAGAEAERLTGVLDRALEALAKNASTPD